MAINFSASPLTLDLFIKMPIMSHTPAADRNPELDQEIDLGTAIDSGDGITYDYPFIPELEITVLGTWLNVGISDSCIDLGIVTSVSFTFYKGQVFEPDSVPEISIEVSEPFFYTDTLRKNWVKWSNIGSLNFDIWKDNVAGERPVDWKGWTYAIKKLANKVVVYGQNGISLLTPVNNFWGMSTVSRVGLLQRGAVCGNDFVHFFIDKKGRLCRLDEQTEMLGYEEYLASLGPSLVMSYDEYNQLIYICDGNVGYVYSTRSKSLGEGPENITGAGYQDGTLYLTASETTVTIEPFEICTDIYDFGSRKNKSVVDIDVGTNVSQTLYAAIDYRLSEAASFASTPWVRVNPNGKASLPCFGVEFRFKFKVLAYEQFDLDYLRVNGVVHNYSYLDTYGR
jgi:hypothetical protein